MSTKKEKQTKAGKAAEPSDQVDALVIPRLTDRVEIYNNSEFGKRFPDSKLWAPTGKFINGIWMMGNNYQNATRFYGAYPPQYLKRIQVLFSDKISILHLFSGSLPEGDYTRFDLLQEAEVNGDAHQLSDYFEPYQFDLIYADPPYSATDADKYGTSMINRFKVLSECRKVLQCGGFVVWLDTNFPMFSKREFDVVGFINIVRSTNHRFRNATIFQAV